MAASDNADAVGRHAYAAIATAITLVLLTIAWIAWRASSPGDAAPIISDPGFQRGLTIDPLPGASRDIHPSDLVVAVDGRPVDDWLRGIAKAPSEHRVLRYRIQRDGHAQDAPVATNRPNVTSARLRTDGGSLLAALAILGLGSYAVYRRRAASAAQTLLVLGAGLVAYAAITTFGYDVSDLTSHRPLFFAGLIAGMACLLLWGMAASYLALTFPRPSGLVGRHRRFVISGYAVIWVGIIGATCAIVATGSATLGRLDTINSVMSAVLTALALLTIAGLLHTLWRAWRDPQRRSQGLVVVLGFSATAIGLLIANLVAGDQKWPAWLDLVILLPLPLAVTAAILRGDFLGIRAVINRSLVYTLLTALLVGSYAAAATAVGALVGDAGVAPELVATAIVAIAFAPLRAALQRAVDNLLYGARGDQATVLRTVGEQLEAATDSAAVLPAIAETVATTLHLPYVAVRIPTDDGTRLAVERGERCDDLRVVPLLHHGTHVGELVVAARRGERSLSETDASLLTDIARQVAPAVRAARLVTDLAATHSRLAVTREAERARLRHDLHDRLGPHLVGLSLQLDTLSARVGDPDSSGAIAKAHEEATLALDEVRRISRGLRPAELEELGLVQAISAAASRLSIADDERAWSVSVDAAVQLGQIPADVEAAAYQIALEGLTNAYRHSQGTTAVVRVGVDTAGRELILEVSDDGRGLDPMSSPGVGVGSMHARAAALGGEVRIGRSPAGGTTIRARLPLS
ncbi:MAG TPA: histidine kinase [Mycobacteriales bacterium]|nr:histidine kinase [Mycobacteriales bacterium]HVW82193.1 histidine kinase [Mycobacteriales bacterium]